MEKQMQIFSNDSFGSIRCAEIDGMPYFSGRDIAAALGYTNPQKAIRDHVDKEDQLVNETFTVNGTPMTLINESGLYSLILTSKLASAKEFKRWVTSSVLPMIRRTGIYAAGVNLKDGDTISPMRLLTPDDYISAARLIATCKSERLNLVLSLLARGGWDIPQADIGAAKRADTSDIAERIRHAKLTAGITWRDLSRMSGISAEVLRSYESGRRFPKPGRYMELVSCIDRIESQSGCTSADDE